MLQADVVRSYPPSSSSSPAPDSSRRTFPMSFAMKARLGGSGYGTREGKCRGESCPYATRDHVTNIFVDGEEFQRKVDEVVRAGGGIPPRFHFGGRRDFDRDGKVLNDVWGFVSNRDGLEKFGLKTWDRYQQNFDTFTPSFTWESECEVRFWVEIET